jgi:hypothetical protein
VSRIGRLDRRRPIHWNHPLNRNLVAWWAGVPGWSGGASVKDLARRGRDGAATGGVSWVGGPPGSPFAGFACDGSTGYVSAGGPALPSYVSGNASATINMWVKLRANSSYPMAFTQQTATDTVIWLGDDLDLKPKWTNPGGAAIKSSTALTLGKWYMLTATAGTFSSPGGSLYLNGVPVATNSATYAPSGLATAMFGRRSDGFYANCVFGPIQFWFTLNSTAARFTDAEVLSLYQEAVQGYPDTLSWARPWSFGFASGSTPNSGSGTGALTLGGTGSGYELPKGSGAGALTLGGTGSGHCAHYGSGTGELTLGGSGDGQAPTGTAGGSGTGTLTLGATGTGYHQSYGSGPAALHLAAAGVGYRPSYGRGTGPITLGGSGRGYALHYGQGAGALTLAGVGRGQAGEVAIRAGGTFCRALPSWARTVSRALPSWSRTWRYTPMLATQADRPVIAAVSDDRHYLFDLQPCPEVAAGAAILSGSIIDPPAGLSFDAPQVLSEAADGIPAGKGLSVRIYGGVAGTVYPVSALVLFDGGQVVVAGRMWKVADSGT